MERERGRNRGGSGRENASRKAKFGRVETRERGGGGESESVGEVEEGVVNGESVSIGEGGICLNVESRTSCSVCFDGPVRREVPHHTALTRNVCHLVCGDEHILKGSQGSRLEEEVAARARSELGLEEEASFGCPHPIARDGRVEGDVVTREDARGRDGPT